MFVEEGGVVHAWQGFTELGVLLGSGDFNKTDLDVLLKACRLIDDGIELLDAVMDDEVPADLVNTPKSILQLRAYNMITLESDAMLSTLPNALQLLKIKRDALLRVSEGQCLDIRLQQTPNWSLADYFKCIKLKTGAWRAMYLQLGAALNGSDASRLVNFVESISIVGQMRNDCRDLFCDEDSVDLRNGLYTYPVIQYTNRLKDKTKWLILLAEARKLLEARMQVREVLKKEGALKQCYLFMTLQLSEVRRDVQMLGLRPKALRVVKDIINNYE